MYPRRREEALNARVASGKDCGQPAALVIVAREDEIAQLKQQIAELKQQLSSGSGSGGTCSSGDGVAVDAVKALAVALATVGNGK